MECCSGNIWYVILQILFCLEKMNSLLSSILLVFEERLHTIYY